MHTNPRSASSCSFVPIRGWIPVPMMKIRSHLLLTSFLLLAIFSREETVAGSCGTTGCNLTPAAPPVQRASATSASGAFTATGGSRVATINLSQEARGVINTEGKEAALPKGFSTAADRAKSIAKETPLYGWPEDQSSRPSLRAQSRYSDTRGLRNSDGKVSRSLARATKPVRPVKVATVANERSKN